MLDKREELKGQGYTDEQVDAILEQAGTMQIEAEGKTSREILEESAEEAGIDREYVQQAIKQVEIDWRRQRVERAQKKRLITGISVGGGALLLLLLLMTQRSLSSQMAVVNEKQAQIQTMVDRRDALLPRLEAGGVDAVAVRDEIAGSENRIATERKRYNEAVAAYNARAAGLPYALFRPFLGFPNRIDPTR